MKIPPPRALDVKKDPSARNERTANYTPKVVPCENFEELLAALCAEMDERAASPRPHPMIVPSVAFKDALQLGIAERRGICMGLDLLTSGVFIARVMDKRDDSPWSPEYLAWRILPHARDFAAQLGVDAESASPRELFAVASLLADQLDQYGHFRPDMIRAWDKGHFFLGNDHANEKWQRKLWTKLKEEIGSDVPHPAVALGLLKGDKAFRDRLQREYLSLTVVGTGTVDPLLVEILALLGEAGCRVTLHVLVPTLEYLGDLQDRKEQLLSLRENPESFEHEAPHPLLTSMGRHAAGVFCLLHEADENLAWPFEKASKIKTPPAAPLLRRLQDDIRKLAAPAGAAVAAGDRSIAVHSCFGPRREMEVLRDEILRAYRDLKDLKPDEIQIVTPSLDVYAPLVSAVLEQALPPGANPEERETSLRVRVTESPKPGNNPVIAAVLALLELAAKKRYEASALLELLHLEPVQRALGMRGQDEEIERLRMRIRNSGVTNGLSENGTAYPETGTWGFARERLIAGLWIGSEEGAQFPDGNFVLPVADEPAMDIPATRAFVEWHARLEHTLREWEKPSNAAGWAGRLKDILSPLLGCRDGVEAGMRKHLLFLESVSGETEVDAGAIYDWFEAATSEDRRRTSVSGKTTLGRFRQLQNLPCRVLAMVGMQEGTFPASHRVPAWDLLQVKPRPWDRNPRIDDRQLFIDAVLAPKERLIITGATLNVRTNETEPFSPCVDELLRVLAAMNRDEQEGSKSLVKAHPLQPFSREYFRDDAPVERSFSRTNEKVARGIAETGGERRPHPFHIAAEARPHRTEPVALELSIKELAGFWKDPAKAYIKAQGIPVWSEQEDDRALDLSPAELDELQGWKIKDAIVREIVEGPGDLKALKARLRADRALPKGLLGDRIWDEHKDAAEALGNSFKKEIGEPLPVACNFTFHMGDVGLPDVEVKVTGELRLNKAGTHLFAWHAGKADKPKHWLEPWFGAKFALQHSHNLLLPTVFLNSAEPERCAKNTKPPVLGSPGDLAEILREIACNKHLIEGFLRGRDRPLRYAPSTSEDIAKHLKGTNRTPAMSLPEAAAKSRKTNWDPRAGSSNAASGEGESDAAKLAWRDIDPFADLGKWNEWVTKVAEPLRSWRKS
jgi:exodeoxyribonuclease V gamma subunit